MFENLGCYLAAVAHIIDMVIAMQRMALDSRLQISDQDYAWWVATLTVDVEVSSPMQ